MQLGCAESSFDLAPDSRLPKWFKVDGALPRADLTVRMSYYVMPNGRTATFTLRDRSGRKLSEKSGTLLGRRPRTPGPNDDGNAPVTYPGYEVVTVDGITEVIEHRHTPRSST
jgi:hypothetical protein